MMITVVRINSELTVCVIANQTNDEVLAFCESFQELTENFILVNTGLENWGKSSYDFKWIDDFSAARNFALEQVKGDGWVMMLDLDNKMSPEDQRGLKQLLSVTEAEVLMMNCSFMSQSSYEPKVWRNYLGLRYEYPVHERLIQPKKCKIAQCDFSLEYGAAEHERYLASRRYYVGIMKKFLESHPDDQRMMYYLVADLYFLKDFERLIPIAKRLLSFEDLRSDEANKVNFWLSKAQAHV